MHFLWQRIKEQKTHLIRAGDEERRRRGRGAARGDMAARADGGTRGRGLCRLEIGRGGRAARGYVPETFSRGLMANGLSNLQSPPRV